MDYRNTPAASGMPSTRPARRPRPATASNTKPKTEDLVFPYDSDASSTIESLRNCLAAHTRNRSHSQHQVTRTDDLLFAAKHARSQMPPQFREPPSSTGSHGTITTSSLQMSNDTDSTFSGGLDAESTRASLFFQQQQRSSHHRVRRSTGRFGSGGPDGTNTGTGVSHSGRKTDFLNGVVNTSALQRVFSEWQPDDATASQASESEHIYRDADADTTGNLDNDSLGQRNQLSSTNLTGLFLHQDGYYDKENQAPAAVQQRPADKAVATAAAKSAAHSRAMLQATVQNESDMSIVMSAAAPALASAGMAKRSMSQSFPQKGSLVATATAAAAAQKMAVEESKAARVRQSPVPEDLTSPETSAASREDLDLGVVPAVEAEAAAAISSVAPAQHDSVHEGVTNQSFIVPSKSYPLLHNLVTGTLRYTPGAFFYGTSMDARQRYELPPGRIPEDEKKIFIDAENIREEVVRLQEHNEMLQNEMVQGERKFQNLLQRFYAVTSVPSPKPSSGGLGPEAAEQQLKELRASQARVCDLEAALDEAHSQTEEQSKQADGLAAQRDAAVACAAAAAEKSKKLAQELEAAREQLERQERREKQEKQERQDRQEKQERQEKLERKEKQERLEKLEKLEKQAAAMAAQQRPNQEAQRRIRQLEQMVAERERVIKATKDESQAAIRSHREECKLFRERIARLGAEKNMVSGDHAKCGEEMQALAAARDALAQKHAALRAQAQAQRQEERQQRKQARQQEREREAKLFAVVERQRQHLAKLQALLQAKEKSVRQLDDNLRRLRASSWASQDETLMRMTEMLAELRVEGEDYEEQEDDRPEYTATVEVEKQEAFKAHEDEERLFTAGEHDETESAQSMVDDSMDENMTSAFIIPDLEFEHEEEEALEEEEPQQAVDGKTHGKTKSVAFADKDRLATATTATVTTTTTACEHNRVNCVVCVQKAGLSGPPQKQQQQQQQQKRAPGEKVTVAVPRPMPARMALPLLAKWREQQQGMDPGRALAYVMKMLDDERRHLWMQLEAEQRRVGAEKSGREGEAARELDELWNAYVLKVEQLNRLDDVLEGQRAAGQEMTREEIDVTITRMLEA